MSDTPEASGGPLAVAPTAELGLAPEPVAYLYHDASVPEDAHPWLHSTMLVLAADRRTGLRGETPLVTMAQAQAMVAAERDQAALDAKDAEIERLRAALRAALRELCDAADETKYPLHGSQWDRLWNAAVAARGVLGPNAQAHAPAEGAKRP